VDTTVLQRKRTTKELTKKDLEKEMWTLGSAGERWRWQHKTERGGDEWSVALFQVYASV